MRKYLLLISILIIIVIALFMYLPYEKEAGSIKNVYIANNTQENIKEKFDSLYLEVRKYSWAALPKSFPSPDSIEPFQEIVALGIPALPYIIEKWKEENKDTSIIYLSIGYAVYRITKANFAMVLKEKNGKLVETMSGFPYVKVKDGEDTRAMFLRWWHEGRKEIPQYFERLYGEWKEAEESRKDKVAKKKYWQIRKMGLFALPQIIAKIKSGDNSLIPLVSELTDGEVKEEAQPEECMEWWLWNKEKWIIPREIESSEANEKNIVDTGVTEFQTDIVRTTPIGPEIEVVPYYKVEKKPLTQHIRIQQKATEIAEKYGIEGDAIVKALIDTDGTVIEVEIRESSGYEFLDEEALKIAKQIKYRPAIARKRKIRVWLSLPIKFRFDE